MRLLPSVRSRMLLGSLLGALGLLALSHIASVVVIHQYRIVLHAGHAVLVALGAVVFVLIGFALVQRGLSPFDQLRTRLSAVREGRQRLLEGVYPTEVQPLVNDLNALLEHRERIVKRAIAKAGDLAHGLKTPLAVLSQEAERAAAAGHPDLAATMSQQIERMRRQIDYHLAHARAAAAGATPGARSSVLESAEGLTRTLLRLHADRGLTIDVHSSPAHAFRGQREDLDEMLGNLLENACQWARSRVTLASAEDGSALVITVDDDGPGLPAAMRSAVLQRGVRADEAAPGSGLGLAIVRDLAELYGGSITLDASLAGGLRAALRLPSC